MSDTVSRLLIRNKDGSNKAVSTLVLTASLASIYFIVAKLSLLLAIEGYASPVWPPSGIAIALLLLGGIRFWPGVLIGAFLSNWQVDGASQLAFQIAIGNTLEAVTAVWLTNRFVGRRYFLNHSRKVFSFTLILVFSCIISALVGALSVLNWPTEIPDSEILFRVFSTWWVGDIVGALVFSPLILAYRQGYRQFALNKKELFGFALFSLVLLEAIFGGISIFDLNSASFAFLPLPLLIAVGYRLGLRGVVLFTLALSVLAITGTFRGFGPFADEAVSQSLVLLQVYIGLVALSGLLLSSIIAEREAARRALLRLSAQLELRVRNSTDELRKANLTLGNEKKHQQSLIQQLVASEVRYRALFDNATEAIMLLDIDKLCFVDANNNAAALFGYPLDELIKIPFANLSPEFQRNGFSSMTAGIPYMHAAVAGEQVCFEWQHLHADGHVIPCEVRLISYPSSNKNLIRACVTDISERIRSSSRQRLIAKVFENTSEGVVITDDRHRVVEVNEACCEMTGYASHDIIGRLPIWLLNDANDQLSIEDFLIYIVENSRWQGEVFGEKKDGSYFPQLLTISAVADEAGDISNFLYQFSDISDFKVKEEKLAYLANYDHLTGLYNRTALIDHMTRMIAEAKRDGKAVSLYFIDLDGFKRVNDSLGHDAGDALLCEVASRIKSTLRSSDLVARLGGDEFTVVAKHSDIGEKQCRLAQKLIDRLSVPYRIASSEIYLTVSIGISNSPQDGNECKLLLKNADIAMYEAKKSGQGSYQFFTNEMNTAALDRMNVEIGLRKALENDEFVLHYQPQIDLSSGSLVGFEALVRWQHPDKGLIAPGDFIEIAEQNGLIAPIGRWVLEQACRQNMAWQRQGLAEVPVAVNLSARQFRFPQELLSHVKETLAATGLQPEMLELELTESMLVENVESAIVTLESLREIGIKLAIDDFGTGYSSLSYLKRFAADKLKIDRSFVRDLEFNGEDAAIVKATIALGHNLNLKVIAEGVENRAQVSFLNNCGCDELQGFLISQPLPAEYIPDLIVSLPARMISSVLPAHVSDPEPELVYR
ncbi:bifunctional diguanylate cyclase/phosphodiesterase [Amphritea sp. HPY]|uniref:bifunctional diguanylate cyclase/phosphodiesterase n=1 Tax=Amphritea sp. HPY TaxID=3421652 RepID=UPI003D7CA733